jgi:polyphosphate kinase
MVRVSDEVARARLRYVMDTATADDTSGFDLQSDGAWVRRLSTPEQPLRDPQVALLERVLERGA